MSIGKETTVTGMHSHDITFCRVTLYLGYRTGKDPWVKTA
jgi:hypothetical protein